MFQTAWHLFALAAVSTCSVLCTAAEIERPIVPVIPSPVERVRPLARKSGYIFAGTVYSVSRTGASSKDIAVVRIVFHVDSGIRGVRTGQTLTIKEWAGLWQLGERYRVGENVLLFLYSPSKLGLTSIVGGGAGRFRVDSSGGVQPVLSLGGPQHPVSRSRPGERLTVGDMTRAIRLIEEETHEIVR